MITFIIPNIDITQFVKESEYLVSGYSLSDALIKLSNIIDLHHEIYI